MSSSNRQWLRHLLGDRMEQTSIKASSVKYQSSDKKIEVIEENKGAKKRYTVVDRTNPKNVVIYTDLLTAVQDKQS